MNRFIALLLTALFAFHGATCTAFTTPAPATLVVRNSQSMVGGSSPFQPQSSTSLNLKVKVDPEAKSKRTNPAAFKNAAYGGSIAIAVALPLIFLVWSALK